ncbi:MAG: hypothetical protein VCD33_05295 [Alphaproteobacteria bacterium]
MKPLSFFARSEFTVLATSVLLVTVMALLAPPVLAATTHYPALFGTAEVRSKNMKAFPKWTGLLERYLARPACRTATAAPRNSTSAI